MKPFRLSWLARLRLVPLIVMIAGLLAGCASQARPTETPMPEGVTAVEPPGPPNDFTLINQANQPVHLNDFRGRLVLMTFGYTHCPPGDECPLNLARFTQVKAALAHDADQVVFVFITIDNQRDTPEVLAKYIGAFDPAFVALTGDDQAIRNVAQDYSVLYAKDKAGVTGDPADYKMTHTASWFLVDRQGRWRRVYSYGTDPEVVAADLRQMLASKS
jgi:protein SCO1/2